MKTAVVLTSVLVLAACAREPDAAQPRAGDASDPVVSFASDDAEMNRAMERARLSLDEFDSRIRQPPSRQQDIGLKGRFEQHGTVEHMWISEVRIASDGYHGILQNEPQIVTGLKMGDAVVVPRDRVSDWYAIEEGHLVAGYTMRIVHDRMSAEERQQFDASAGFTIDD